MIFLTERARKFEQSERRDKKKTLICFFPKAVKFVCDSGVRRQRVGEMIVSQNIVADTEIICQQGVPVLDMKYHLCVAAKERNLMDVTSSPSSPGIREVRVTDSVSTDISRFESVRSLVLFISLQFSFSFNFCFHQLGSSHMVSMGLYVELL